MSVVAYPVQQVLMQRISSRIMHCKIKATIIDWTVKKRNSLLLLDSNSYHRLTCLARTVTSLDLKRLRKTETWPDCQVISSNISSYVAAGSCSNRWDCCSYDRRLQQSLGLLLRIELQQSLGLLSRARGWGKCWPCRSKALRQKLILPFITVAADAGFCRWLRLVTLTKFYLEAVQDVCWCWLCFCARLVL